MAPADDAVTVCVATAAMSPRASHHRAEDFWQGDGDKFRLGEAEMRLMTGLRKYSSQLPTRLPRLPRHTQSARPNKVVLQSMMY